MGSTGQRIAFMIAGVFIAIGLLFEAIRPHGLPLLALDDMESAWQAPDSSDPVNPVRHRARLRIKTPPAAAPISPVEPLPSEAGKEQPAVGENSGTVAADEAAAGKNAATETEEPKGDEKVDKALKKLAKKGEANDKKAKDDAKKNAEKEKKKKEEEAAKAKAQSLPAVQQEQPTAESDGKKDGSGTDSDSGPSGGGYSTITPIPAKAPSAFPESPAEWRKRLLDNPDMELVQKFVELQQTHTLPDGFFHEMIQAMLLDGRPELREFAIVALGATPSARSFQLLVEAMTLLPPEAPLRQQVRNYLMGYAQPENIQFLRSALTPSNSGTLNGEISLTALRLVRLSASQTLKRGTPTRGGANDVHALSRRHTVQSYVGLVPLLQQLATQHPDQSYRQEAGGALSEIAMLTP